MSSKSHKTSIQDLKKWGLTAFSFFLGAVAFGSLGENLIKGTIFLETLVSIYKLITVTFLNIFWKPLAWIGIPTPPRTAMDIVVLLNIAFRFLIWPLKNISSRYKYTVTVIASISVFMIIYAGDWLTSNYQWLAISIVFLSILTLIGSFTILANQRLFADGLTLRTKTSTFTREKVYIQPQRKLLLSNLFLWPYIWLIYYGRTRREIFKRMIFSICVVATIVVLGLLIRAIDDYADITLPSVKRFGKALDEFIETL